MNLGGGFCDLWQQRHKWWFKLTLEIISRLESLADCNLDFNANSFKLGNTFVNTSLDTPQRLIPGHKCVWFIYQLMHFTGAAWNGHL